VPPTRHLAAYAPTDKRMNMDAVAHQRAGKPWPDVTRTAEIGT